jgi:hypothetical protein
VIGRDRRERQRGGEYQQGVGESHRLSPFLN